MTNDSKCPHCGEVRQYEDFNWLVYHEDECHVGKLEAENKTLVLKLDSKSKDEEEWLRQLMEERKLRHECESRLGELTAENSRLGNELFERSDRLNECSSQREVAIREVDRVAKDLTHAAKEIEFLRPKYDEAAALVRRARDERAPLLKTIADCGDEIKMLESRLGSALDLLHETWQTFGPQGPQIVAADSIWARIAVTLQNCDYVSRTSAVEIHCRLCGKLCDRHLPGELVVWTCPECIKDLSVERKCPYCGAPDNGTCAYPSERKPGCVHTPLDDAISTELGRIARDMTGSE